MKQECEALQNDSDFDHGENAPTQPALCWKGQEAPGEPEHHGLLERAHKGALKQITTPGLFELLVHFLQIGYAMDIKDCDTQKHQR